MNKDKLLYIVAFLSFILITSCANNKAEKLLKEIEEREKTVNTEEVEDTETVVEQENNCNDFNFFCFLSKFPEKNIPFDLKDIAFSSYIESLLISSS